MWELNPEKRAAAIEWAASSNKIIHLRTEFLVFFVLTIGKAEHAARIRNAWDGST
jgi:hypothetical protein